MSYGFYVNSKGGQFGWLNWRNKIPVKLVGYMKLYENVFWGRCWLDSAEREAAMQELIRISEDLGFYDADTSSSEPRTQDLG